jgi:Vitamin K-dependent gamma-carboxylase
VDRWNAWWFPPASTLHLAICRIVAVGAQLVWFHPNLAEHVNLLRKNHEFIEPQLITRILAAVFSRDAFFSPSMFTALYWVTFAFGILALVGLFTRLSLFLFATGTWIFVAHLFSYGDRHHTEALFAIFLMLLALAPSGERLSVDAALRRRRTGVSGAETSELAIWPLKLMLVLLSLTYLSAGMAKMLHSGLRWMNGYTLQGHTLADALSRGYPIGVWLAQQHTIAVLLSIFTIVFELFFWVSLLVPRRWVPGFLMVALLFQVGLYVTGGYDFFQHMVLLVLLLLFLNPDWWQRRAVARVRASGSSPETGVRAAAP